MSADKRAFKSAIYEQLARVGKALSSGPRLELLDLLCQGPRTVDALAHEVGQSSANASHHLKVLLRARLVETRKSGVHVTYRLAEPAVDDFYQRLKGLAGSRLVEIADVARRFREARGAFEEVDLSALVERVERGEVTVLDVRPSEEYRAGHIAGARSIPLPELEARLAELPAGREVVAYCRGPYCVMAFDAVEVLRARGFTATRLEDGVSEWRARGLEVAVG